MPMPILQTFHPSDSSRPNGPVPLLRACREELGHLPEHMTPCQRVAWWIFDIREMFRKKRWLKWVNVNNMVYN